MNDVCLGYGSRCYRTSSLLLQTGMLVLSTGRADRARTFCYHVEAVSLAGQLGMDTGAKLYYTSHVAHVCCGVLER